MGLIDPVAWQVIKRMKFNELNSYEKSVFEKMDLVDQLEEKESLPFFQSSYV